MATMLDNLAPSVLGALLALERGMATGSYSHMLRMQCCKVTGGSPPRPDLPPSSDAVTVYSDEPTAHRIF